MIGTCTCIGFIVVVSLVYSYKVEKMEGYRGFIVDVKILICFDFDGNLTCIPTKDGLPLLKNQEIPLCDKEFPFDNKSE